MGVTQLSLAILKYWLFGVNVVLFLSFFNDFQRFDIVASDICVSADMIDKSILCVQLAFNVYNMGRCVYEKWKWTQHNDDKDVVLLTYRC